MTVEISMLFPVIISILMCIFYIMFYSYNRTIAFQNAAITALYGKNGIFAEEEQVERMYTVLETINRGQFLALDKLKQKVSIEGNYYVVEQNGNVNIPLINSEIMSGLNFLESIEVSNNKAVFNIRQIRKAKSNDT